MKFELFIVFHKIKKLIMDYKKSRYKKNLAAFFVVNDIKNKSPPFLNENLIIGGDL